MSKTKSTKQIEEQFELDIYPRREVVIVRGKASKLYDDKDREYIDCASNVGVSNIGHANEQVATAIHEQYLRLANCYSMFYNDIRARFAQKLVEIMPHFNNNGNKNGNGNGNGQLSKVFFCNSGSEAVEAAIKFARATTGKKQIICAMRGFHGKTMGALAATWGPEYQKPFMPMLEGFVHVPFNNYDRFEKSVSDDTAAVIVEVVQGEGGVRPADKEYLKKLSQFCRAVGILLIVDEVQTGFGRTGKMFASEHYDISPDILCLAKSIAGGIPMGAVVCKEKIIVPKRSHTSTFGGNPLACAAALASIDFIEKENLVERAAELGEYFIEKLSEIKSPKIKEIRGIGLMIGIELTEKAGPYVAALMEMGVIALLAGNFVIRLLPPLVISKEEIDKVVDALGDVLQEQED
ncbi:MAG: aspartate aminotransferase family protein [Nanoarchaeota archaeon]|nr:aspartate aminotransferase family protein [Nanoarchaeota archaeon]MBU1321261.1 aspartate aminotransferase family protein [Nanoarchaeota archaeon]MBU1597332.1 aspartate aminotransferase family protein [Nanoarchaeota archaeon]MBU2441455.1 aspartate aminotransferase family protein [Nanoarchaeota archaeon]